MTPRTWRRRDRKAFSYGDVTGAAGTSIMTTRVMTLPADEGVKRTAVSRIARVTSVSPG